MDPDVEALYGLPLDEFTKARDALARARTKEEGKEAGAAVKGLRKPSVVAWALNQLARARPQDVEALLEAGARVRRAQTATLEGGDPDELREATKAEAADVQALAAHARSILADTGRGDSPANEERLAATLRAAAVDTEAGELLRRGTLTTELSPAGFGFGIAEGDVDPSLLLTSSRPARTTQQKQKGEAKEANRKEEERAERERRREQEQELRAAQETAARLEREAERAEEQAREAREKADAAAKRAEELERALENAPKMSKGRKG